jgi:type I restriction enzyme S subunit
VNPKDDPEKEITYLDIGGIDNEALKITETKTFIGVEAPSRARQLVKDGDVLFSTVRTYLKKIAQVPEHFDGAIASTGFTVLRGSDVLDPKYLFYYVTQDAFIKPLSKIQRGTSYPAVRDSDVLAQLIQLAPLPEQRRIVARIEELFSRLDAGVAALRHAKAQLQRYRQSVLAAAVTGQLTQAWREQHPDSEPAEELLQRILKQRREQWNGRGKYNEPHDIDGEIPFKAPGSWSWTSSEAVCASVRDGTHDTPKYVEEGVPLITSKNLLSSGLSFENTKNISQADHAEISKRSGVSDGDILFAMIGTIGNPIVVRTSTQFSIKNVALFKSNESFVSSEYLRVWLSSPIFMSWLEPKQKGTTQKFVPLGLLRSLAIPLPPLAEQHQIVAEVEARTTAIDHLEAELDRQITRSNRLRQSALASAFTGKF